MVFSTRTCTETHTYCNLQTPNKVAHCRLPYLTNIKIHIANYSLNLALSLPRNLVLHRSWAALRWHRVLADGKRRSTVPSLCVSVPHFPVFPSVLLPLYFCLFCRYLSDFPGAHKISHGRIKFPTLSLRDVHQAPAITSLIALGRGAARFHQQLNSRDDHVPLATSQLSPLWSKIVVIEMDADGGVTILCAYQLGCFPSECHCRGDCRDIFGLLFCRDGVRGGVGLALLSRGKVDMIW